MAKCQKAVCGDIRHHEKAKCWKGQAAKRGQFGAKKANIHWFKKLKRAGKGQAWCKKANIYWLKEWSHIGRHLLQRLFRNGWSRNNLNLLKKEKNKNTTSLLKYNTAHLSRTFPLFQGAHTQNHPLALHRKRDKCSICHLAHLTTFKNPSKCRILWSAWGGRRLIQLCRLNL